MIYRFHDFVITEMTENISVEERVKQVTAVGISPI